jgi:hypothetical protein
MAGYGDEIDADIISRLQEENERLKDDVFVLLDVPTSISESSIKAQYTDICDAIESWVEDIHRTYNPDAKGTPRLPLRKRRSILRSFGVDADRVADYIYAGDLCLSVIIERQLREQIFDNKYPIGISKSQTKVLDEVQKGMEIPRITKGRPRCVFLVFGLNPNRENNPVDDHLYRSLEHSQVEIGCIDGIDGSPGIQAESVRSDSRNHL